MAPGATDRAVGTRRRHAWFDPRFAIGLVLVVASTLGVVALVAAADVSTAIYAARTVLLPGQRVDVDDLVLVEVRLAGADERYLAPATLPTAGALVSRVVDSGELVPISAVGRVTGERLTSVVVDVASQLAGSVRSGAVVDLWSSRQEETRVFSPPTVLVGSATVVRIVENDGFVVDGGAGAIELLVPASRVARVLEAIANEDVLAVVPVGVPVGE